ncbi:MAG: glycosyltransferase family 2 protein [Sphingopyxis sp.]|nr:glycosyltransferase family 2 protein [Sphingopyxis sp.]
MKRPEFSVLIPVYNAAETLPATVRSVLTQSQPDFELILVDDGSRDASLAIMLELAASDRRIRVVQQANGGVAAARNLAMELARGRFLAFLDADDLWHPKKLAQHAAFHVHWPDLAISFARVAFSASPHVDDWSRQTCSAACPGVVGLSDLLAENPACTMSNMVVSRAAAARIGPFRSGMNFAEDQEWLVRAAAAGLEIRCLDAVLVAYRFSPDGLSINLEKMYAGWRDLVAEHGTGADIRASEAVYCRYLARRALRAGTRPRTALHYALLGLRLHPPSFLGDCQRGWTTLVAACAAPFLPRWARLRLFA